MNIRIVALAAALVMISGTATITGATDQPQPPAATTTAVESPTALVPEMSYQFDPVVDGTLVIHDFVIKNNGGGMLEISQVKTG